MAYLDTSDHDDHRSRDEPGRRSQAARPAWDAATYGTPEDLRRRPPVRGRGGYPDGQYTDGQYTDAQHPDSLYPDSLHPESRYPAGAAHAPSTDRYRSQQPYPPDPYPADPYPADPYPADPYPADPYPADRYPADPYPPERNPGVAYPPDPYPYSVDSYAATESYAADTAAADSYAASYAAQAGYADDAFPGGMDHGEPDPPAPASGRGGRNLQAAIGVGVALAVVAVGALFLWRPAFLGVIAVAIGIGVWELVRALRTTGRNPPLVPLVVGGTLMTGLGWWGQADGLTFGLIVTVLAVMVWRLADGAVGYARDVTAATLVAVYVPFLAGFAALLASPADGGTRVLVTLACVVLSDTGGYIAGALRAASDGAGGESEEVLGGSRRFPDRDRRWWRSVAVCLI